MKLKKLATKLVSLMPRLTVQRSVAQALENARLNLPYIQRSVLDLEARGSRNGGDSAIVIAAGPSLHRRNPVPLIRNKGYDGVTVAADGALGYCLRNGLVPDYVVVLDPHPTRVCRWFGDPNLDSREDDDYFRRQDLDPHLGVNERLHNRDLIELVNRYGRRIKVIISSSASLAVTRRCLDAGMDLYWWNPIFDDFNDPESLTRKVYRMNKVPCMVSGGNVGTAAWVFAHTILSMKKVATVGMDLSYAPGTPFENTQYYKEIKELFGERASEAYIKVYNPYLKETWFTDPAYYWYRQSFLEMVPRTDCKTFNCTEGGILFGKGIRFVQLWKFLSTFVGN